MLQFLPNHLCPSFVPSFPSFPCLSLHVPCSPALFSFHLPSSPVLFASLLLFAPVCARFRSRAHGRSKLKMFGSIWKFFVKPQTINTYSSIKPRIYFTLSLISLYCFGRKPEILNVINSGHQNRLYHQEKIIRINLFPLFA